jgi:chorismate mutase
MADQDAQDKIAALRGQIDAIDCQLVSLLNERALKPQMNWSLYDPKREEEIFSNLAKCNDGPLYDDNLREVYEAVLHVMKEL